MDVRTSFAETALAPQQHEFDQDTLQDVSLACVEGDARASITLPNMSIHDTSIHEQLRCFSTQTMF